MNVPYFLELKNLKKTPINVIWSCAGLFRATYAGGMTWRQAAAAA
jgi:hypothetical protein